MKYKCEKFQFWFDITQFAPIENEPNLTELHRELGSEMQNGTTGFRSR